MVLCQVVRAIAVYDIACAEDVQYLPSWVATIDRKIVATV